MPPFMQKAITMADTAVEKIYERHIKPLTMTEQLRLIVLIAQGLSDPTIRGLEDLICGKKRRRVFGGMPMSAFRPFILKALAELGGQAREGEVLARVEKMVGPYLQDLDREELPTGDYRWRKKARWERFKMKGEGLLRADSQRSIWELTEKGWEEARKLLESET